MPGIPKNILSRIFEPFYTTKKVGEGTGMGLAIVYGIVKSHGAAITVDSEVGDGATFSVYFPANDGQPQKGSFESYTPPKGKESVLIVHDEPLVVEIAEQLPLNLGYKVTTAQSGLEGWKIFENDPHRFDVVITDHVMPDINGMKLAGRMLHVRRDLPIILFTGYSETVSASEAKAVGIREFLMKPVVKKELAETVRKVLDGK